VVSHGDDPGLDPTRHRASPIGPVIAQPRPVDEDGKMTLTLRVNGRTHRVKARAHHTLLDVLRGQLKLFAVREGCGVGMCGACTVLIDGQPVSSCLTLAALAEGKDILTVEGLQGDDLSLHPIQQAYIDHTAFQCSYCTPGFILSTKALLDENPNPTKADVREYLSGNLCRCGSYIKIMDAVLDARDRLTALKRTPDA
jgi:carbon-monoxide dehydrogenase small subunit/isoquinoline 1-oxidoreductase alpha subunit/xanthine dehydrogenase YagT iron-sulfur-binding subunit